MIRSTGYPDLRAFITVAEMGSFSKAADKLNVSPSALSQTIRQFEERMGIRLLHRTTRSVTLTSAGESLLLRVRPALVELDAALEDVGQMRETPAGIVRVKTFELPYRIYLAPLL